MRRVNARQVLAETASRGPTGFLLSRTPTNPGWLATSTQFELLLL
jgi:hypothetical protein